MSPSHQPLYDMIQRRDLMAKITVIAWAAVIYICRSFYELIVWIL